MNKIPLEICERMFSFACTDDGTTGCSLSLVSRYVRDASRRVRLQSVALQTYQQMQKFCVMVENLAPRHRRVHHLLLTGPTNPDAPNMDNLDRQTRLRVIRAWKDQLQEEGKAASLIVARVVNAIAPTVRVLCLFLPRESQIELTHIGVRLPFLEEITLPDASVLCPLTITTPVELFPNLKRLHLAGPYVDHLDHVLRFLPQLATSLTHVRISGLEQSRRDPYELRDALRPPGHSSFTSEEAHDLARFPATLQEIIVQMGPQPSCDFRIFSPGVLPYELVQGHFVALGDEIGGCKITVLAPQRDMDEYDFAEAKRLWLDRANQGPGCWVR